MIHTKAIHMMDGEVITITEEEAETVQKLIIGGTKWIKVQGEMINSSSIKRIGNHHATALIKKLKRSDKDIQLKLAGKGKEVDKRIKEEKRIVLKALKNRDITIIKILDK